MKSYISLESRKSGASKYKNIVDIFFLVLMQNKFKVIKSSILNRDEFIFNTKYIKI